MTLAYPKKAANAVAHHVPPFDVRSAAQYCGVSISFLNTLRITGGGPPFLKLGRKIAYDVEDLRSWLASRRRTSTSQMEAA